MNSARDLVQAVEHGSIQRVRELLSADAALGRARNDRGVSVLLEARYRGRFDVVEALLDARAGDVDVFEAAALGQVSALERLLSRDTKSVESFSADGFTPLHLACYFAQASAVKLLLARGANVEAASQNAQGLRALHAAAAGGSAESVEMLLARGADPDARQRGGFTALHAAANAGRADIARSLLVHGANPALATDEGKTALELATAKGHAAFLQVLRATRAAGG